VHRPGVTGDPTGDTLDSRRPASSALGAWLVGRGGRVDGAGVSLVEVVAEAVAGGLVEVAVAVTGGADGGVAEQWLAVVLYAVTSRCSDR